MVPGCRVSPQPGFRKHVANTVHGGQGTGRQGVDRGGLWHTTPSIRHHPARHSGKNQVGLQQ